MLRFGFAPAFSARPVKPSRDIARLIEIMAALRTPGSGCPWDLEQNFQTIAPYTLEEAYEVADAIARGDWLASRTNSATFCCRSFSTPAWRRSKAPSISRDVVESITAKLIRRHPHVFADAEGQTAEAVEGLWERIKAEEKAERGEAAPAGALTGVPVALPALTRALKLQDKAGRVGFDWNDPRTVLAKIREEADEIEAELANAAIKAEAAAEVGDLLFAVVNLARHLGANPGRHFARDQPQIRAPLSAIERALAARGKTPKDATLAEMDALWDEAKAAEKARPAIQARAAFGPFCRPLARHRRRALNRNRTCSTDQCREHHVST